MARKRKTPQLKCPDGWQLAIYHVATHYGPNEVHGIVRDGLGLHLLSSHRCRYVKKDGTRTVREYWSVTHLNSGHGLIALQCGFDQAVDFAESALEIGDWDFFGLRGYQNMQPDLPEKFRELVGACKQRMPQSGQGNQAVALAISTARQGVG